MMAGIHVRVRPDVVLGAAFWVVICALTAGALWMTTWPGAAMDEAGMPTREAQLMGARAVLIGLLVAATGLLRLMLGRSLTEVAFSYSFEARRGMQRVLITSHSDEAAALALRHGTPFILPFVPDATPIVMVVSGCIGGVALALLRAGLVPGTNWELIAPAYSHLVSLSLAGITGGWVLVGVNLLEYAYDLRRGASSSTEDQTGTEDGIVQTRDWTPAVAWTCIVLVLSAVAVYVLTRS